MPNMEDPLPSKDMLSIPTVTEEDLRDFHSRQFPHAPLPTQFFQGANALEFEDDDDDGLGHYPDGVKRTLTNEQIAMFRHSEIEFLLRERRRQQELEGSASPAQRERPVTESSSKKEIQSIQSHDRPEAGRGSNRKQQKNKKRKREADPLKSLPYSEEEMVNRRAARELDEQKDVSVELDY